MNELINEITKLTEEWYFLIGKDHHKDRDCHWHIETKWSYGYAPIYMVYHHGYILNDIEIECSSYDEALKTLKDVLTEKIKQEKKFIEERRDEDEW
jgi:hypothetical protein